MIKYPISKTGNIKYLEVFKIFVLISFFYAIISNLNSTLILNNILVYFAYLIVGVLIFLVVYVNVIEISEILKNKLWFLLQIYQVKLKNVYYRYTDLVNNLFFKDLRNINLKFCVVRC
ncbi:hypothetical protein CI105_08855 [Candidatus Izimaplasma bacterium ZiA1]|uniref:hypothetical protein n=1 Tax=Candidatus Izimoplasma sp. ZiA1 TaxID=2024899 RepID=UPI000BAA8EBF|nr:hypothetical protein CI105_08855 [Candidatus Izimaplasma bacterium ZiA1]